MPALRTGSKNGVRDYNALHKMLMILEDKDPTLRLSARSWLQDSKSNYSRIIDPLLKEFMSNNQMFRSFSGQLFYEDKYNTEYVKENFQKLRNIILTTQEEFIKYVVLEEYTDYIRDDVQNVYTLVTGKTIEEMDGTTAEPAQRQTQGVTSISITPEKSRNKYI